MGLDLIYSREHLSNRFKFHFVQISFILNLNPKFTVLRKQKNYPPL